MSEMFAGFKHGLVGVVSPQLLTNHRVPEAVVVVVEVHWQVRAALLPHLMHLWRLGELLILVLVGGLALQLLTPDLLELSKKAITKLLRSQVNSGEMVKILSKR